MKKGNKGVAIPKEREMTVRQEIIEILKDGFAGISELSQLIGKSEKEIVEQLNHIKKAVKLEIEPAECQACGYQFVERDRIKKPGKCPKCRKTRIVPARFSAR